eukprot:TRINITY_DN16912_c0_g1_i1.p1 TRINITY_DN16912_c0_g1~~TRINITY_DN16912_c0_g1_i1.p1  ORF type:complete len:793 (+),score=215.95 TRINITY_DN16912_c0_g1_i1:30-2381(+)
MDEVDDLRRENALLRQINSSLEVELKLARESQAASYQQIRTLIDLNEKYSAQLRSQTQEDQAALGTVGRMGGKQRSVTPPVDTSLLSQPGTPIETQQLVHDSPPAPVRGSGYIPPQTARSPIPVAQRPIRPFPIKKQRKAFLTGDTWAPKGSPFDADLVVGVTIPTLPSGARIEPMLLGGRIYKIQLELENGDTQLLFFNGTRDMQFTLDYHFLEGSRLAPGDHDVAVSSDFLSFSLTVFPGAIKTLVRGIVNGYSMNMRYGYASTSCLDCFREEYDRRLVVASNKVRSLCHSSDISPTDSASVADLCALGSTTFVDPEFPPSQESLSRVFEEPTTLRPWLRLEEALSSRNTPTGLAPKGIEANDIDAGLLGDSWLLSALAVIAEDPRSIMTIFESSYSSSSRTTMSQDHRVGVYRLRLCKGGWWQTVIIDDWLPASPLGPAFARSISSAGALWPALLQKAFAKMYGSYSSLRGGGDTLNALTDLTGCGCDYFNWRAPSEAWAKLEEAVNEGYLVIVTAPGSDPASASEDAGSLNDSNSYMSVGLVTGYSYLVLKAADGHCVLRNVWGDPSLWQGPKDEDTGTITVSWSKMCQMFDSGGVCYAKPGQISLRVQVQFTSHEGPNVMVALQVLRECTVIVTIHQQDMRGSHGDPEECVACCTSVIGDRDGQWTLIDSSHGGTFWRGRDTVLRVSLQPSAKPYYFIPRAYKEEVSTSMTFSFVFQGKCEGNITRFLQPTPAVMESLYFNPIYNFDPSACQPIRPLVQTGRDAPMASQSVTITESPY